MDIKAFLSSLKLPKLTEEQNESLIKDITTQELLTEITKLKLNKSPSTDGFTAEWYKKLKEQLAPILLVMLHFMERRFLIHGMRQSFLLFLKKEKIN